MGRTLSQSILIICLMIQSRQAFCAGAIVFDATNAPRLITLVEEAKRQFQELKGMSDKLENMNGRLGGVLPNTSVERLTSINNVARDWGVYLDGFGSPDAAQLSLLNLFGYQNFGNGNGNKLVDINNFLSDKLYPGRNQEISGQKLEEIKRFRLDALERSTINGVALAGEKKHSLQASQRKIAQLGSDALRAETIHADLMSTNKILTLIASELVQQRELLSQQLELMSAVVAQGTPVIAKNPPAAQRR